MKLTYEQIIQVIQNSNFDFKNSFDESPKNKFEVASTKLLVDQGFYFVVGREYDFSKFKNSLILVDHHVEDVGSNYFINVSNPQLVHYTVLASFDKKYSPGIHPTAIIDSGAKIDSQAFIGPYCVIGKCEIGAGVVLKSHVNVEDRVTIKRNTVIDAFSSIGVRGMAWIWDGDGSRVIQPQFGGVIIQENCLIGTDVTVVRGSLSENTVVGKGTIIAHGSKVGHGSQIGTDVHFANNVSLAGNAVIGDRSFLGSGAVISSNVEIAEGTIVGAGAVVNKTYLDKYITLAGVPAQIIKRNNFDSKARGVPLQFKDSK